MESDTLHIAALQVDGTEPSGVARGGVLISANPSSPPWLVHVQTTRNTGWALGAEHDLEIITREGDTVVGRATLRQSDGWGHLFQAASEIERHKTAADPVTS
jgi:hypothetical protein